MLGREKYGAEMIAAEKWTTEAITQAIYDEVEQYIVIDRSQIALQEDAISEYKELKKNHTIKEFLEAGLQFLLTVFGFVVARRLSKKALFDEVNCKLVKWSGVTICISSMILPFFDRRGLTAEILGLVIDLQMFSVGLAFIVLAYVLKHGAFLQEEYDTML